MSVTFTNTGYGYSCNEPGDQSGVYIPLEEALNATKESTMAYIEKNIRIEKLEQERDALKAFVGVLQAALYPFQDPIFSRKMGGNKDGDNSPIFQRNDTALTLGDFRRANSLLGEIAEGRTEQSANGFQDWLNSYTDSVQKERDALRGALLGIVLECEEYLRINHLHGADGGPATNHAIEKARRLLGRTPTPQPAAEPEPAQELSEYAKRMVEQAAKKPADQREGKQ